ncbi:MAG: BatA domain-containing protein [Spirosomataceae bacterium]
MSFLYPTFLFGLFATAIPVIIHLFNFRRTKRVFFTNVAFLKQVNTTTSSFRRLKHLLIMATRMLFLACLALAFAQPFLPARNSKGFDSSGITSFYLDNSLSMQNEVDNKRYLDFAVTKLEELLTIFNNGTNLQLVTNDFDSREHELNTSGQLKERLSGVELSHLGRSLDNVLRRQLSLAAKHNPNGGNQLFWFSDFQKSTVGDLTKLKIDSTNRLYLVPVQAKNTQNVFVDSVWLSTPFIREMQSNRLSVRLRNGSDQPIDKLAVQLYIDDNQVASQTVSLSARNMGVTTFSFTVREKGFRRGRISFDDSPITFDNDFYFVLNAAPVIQVLHLYGQASAQYVPNVFANDSLFAFRSYSASNADVGQFKTANLIVLEGVEQVEGSVKTELETFVRNGGSLVVVPPSRPTLVAYESFLADLGVRGLVLNGRAITPQDLQPLAEPAKQSPFFFDIFENTTIKENLAMPNASAVWAWQTVGDKLLTFRNNQSFLSASTVQQGKLYLLASPLDASFGEFARNALFVPVMYKIAAMSVRQEPTAYSFRNNTFTLELPAAPNQNAVFKLKKEKLEIIPIQHLNGNLLTVELPKSNQLSDNQEIESGYYELVLNNKTEKLLAFNHDNKESLMDFYSPEELKSLFAGQKNVQVFDKLDDDGFVKEFREQNIGKALWKYFVIAALVFLLIEIALIRFMKG